MAVLAIRVLLALLYFLPEICSIIFLVWLMFYVCLTGDCWNENQDGRNLDDGERSRRIHDIVARELRLQIYLDQQVEGSLDNNVAGRTKDYIYERSMCKNENYDCVICLEEFKEKETVRVVEPCNHLFHKYCLTKWLPQHQTCPTCRHPIPSLSYAPANATIPEV
ncbi:RING-H2 finger protein ATL16 [Tanacetum coccineum]